MSRETMLAKIRAAVGSTQPTAIARDYRRQTGVADLAERLSERISEYRANVQHCSQASLPDTIAATFERLAVQTVAIPADLEYPLPANIKRITDSPNLTAHDLEHAEAVLTGSALAIAETGTIVLDHDRQQGRRILSLVPDIHVCVVMAANIVDNLPSAIERLASSIQAKRPLTFISGPSATSDIELNRVEGVHGPRRLEVIVVKTL